MLTLSMLLTSLPARLQRPPGLQRSPRVQMIRPSVPAKGHRGCIAARARDSGAEAAPAGTQPVSAEWAQEVLGEIVDTTRADFGRRGEAWFAAQVVALLLVAFPPAGLRPVVDALGVGAVLAGLGLAAAGLQALGTNLTPLPKPRDSAELVSSGAYGLVRHPMYGGLILIAAGLTLATGNETRLVMALLTALVLDKKASYEESLLGERFGAAYDTYRAATKKLIPFLY